MLNTAADYLVAVYGKSGMELALISLPTVEALLASEVKEYVIVKVSPLHRDRSDPELTLFSVGRPRKIAVEAVFFKAKIMLPDLARVIQVGITIEVSSSKCKIALRKKRASMRSSMPQGCSIRSG